MIAAGFVGEVERLLERVRPLPQAHAVAGVSAPGRLPCRRGGCGGAIRLIKRDTRRYAKRQMTWFAADPEIIWLAPDEINAAAERIGCFLGR